MARLLARAATVALTGMLVAAPSHLQAQDTFSRTRDRGTGVALSQFGTFIRRGEVLVYPFVEWYYDSNLEYKPAEFGFSDGTDYRGEYRGTEGLLFLALGLGEHVAVELEAAYISASLEKSPADTSAMPGRIEESGLGDVEGQLRWRFQRETDSRPELFTYFETVLPLQKDKQLIGTADWEFKLGIGLIRAFRWGTMMFRSSVEYSGEENKMEWGEYAIEYLRRLSPAWRLYVGIEGAQLDEVSLITEVQWHLSDRAFLKVNNGWGLTPNATDFAPEVGLMLRFRGPR